MRRTRAAAIALAVSLLACVLLFNSVWQGAITASPVPLRPQIGETEQATLYASFDTAYEQEVTSSTEKAALLATWMRTSDWQSLDLDRKSRLAEALAVRGTVDDVMAVRWTGSLQAPAAGEYSLVIYHNEYFRGYAKVWVNDQLVLDASNLDALENGQPSYVSSPVSLSVDDPASLKVEFSHLPRARRPPINHDPLPHTATALLWESASLSRQLVPPTAFSPPEGFAATEQSGLKGEFFADEDFGQLLFSRHVDAVGLHSQVVLNQEQWPEHQAARDDCFAELLDPAFADSVSSDLVGLYWSDPSIERFLLEATTWQRAEYAKWLSQKPTFLAADPGKLGALFAPIAMTPGDARLELLTAWADQQTIEPIKVGFFPDVYEDVNGQYEAIGKWLQVPWGNEVETLAESSLAQADGSCNVALAAVLAYGAVMGDRYTWLDQFMDEQAESVPFNSDQRASWLIATGYLEAVAGGFPVRPNLAMPYLTEAMLVAQSTEMKFNVLAQQVPRLISLGRFDAASDLLSQRAGQFQSASQQGMIADWQAEADRLQSQWDAMIAERKQAAEQQRRAQRQALLQARLESAEQRGDTSLGAKYRTWLQD